MAKHSDSDSARVVDLSRIDKVRLQCAAERQKRANDTDGNIEDYLSSTSESGSDSDSSEAEDDNGDLISPELDAQIMKTLTALQTKDSSVYDEKVNFFSEEAVRKAEAAWKAKKVQESAPGMTLTEYQLKVDMEHGGVVDEEREVLKTTSMTHVEEQRALKNAFKEAADADEQSDDDVLVKKQKTNEESAREDAEYRKFLLENVTGDVSDRRAFMSWAGSNDAESGAPGSGDQKFLMNYILNRGWINTDMGSTVHEIVDKEEDDELIDRTDDFESKFNFRFAEEGGTQITSYPREIEGSLRRTDDRRKLARERAKERKAELKRQKAEELKRAKNQKKRAVLDKLAEIQAITGNSSVGFDDLDLEGDFDADKFQAQMTKLFDNAEYDDSVKPTWDDDIEIDDIVDADGDAEGDDFIMDADYLEPTAVDPQALASTTRELKATVSDYMDNYYQQDFEDVIGDDLTTRFKYAKVKPVNFGLSAAEILLADDSMLNEYVSIKKMAAYRPEWKLDEDEAKHSNKKRQKYIQRKAAALREEWEQGLQKPAKSKGKKRSSKDKSKKSDGTDKPKSDETDEPKSDETRDKPDKKDKSSKKRSSPSKQDAEPAADKKLNRRQRKKAKSFD
ncbi:Ribosome biogenesis protein Kri1 [Coemansia sp. RSA 1822]|nr:Ribosome biogenesis protein Kri1 [Coemansia sp. RSA 638]KAJ2538213.1 Ribosome biogenesis protein Kri1 [Coemansia sp. RSA 1853]KAJ2563163.1 Ribosome biogenesis protein Kri1 [Coemansia sp. RSA 1822]